MMLNTFHNAEFSNDRFGNPKSALLLNHGHVKVPPGIYFDPATGGFTIMLWIKVLSHKDWLSILDFANGVYVDNILVEFLADTKKLICSIQKDFSGVEIRSNSAINLNE